MVIANATDSHLYFDPPIHQPASQSRLPAMIVCVCHRISDREIARHVRAGMDFDDIQFELGVATQCGQCESCAREVVAQCSATPVAAIQLASSITEGRAWTSQQASGPV
jgi:bacterioferritin-associated ferredoxin